MLTAGLCMLSRGGFSIALGAPKMTDMKLQDRKYSVVIIIIIIIIINAKIKVTLNTNVAGALYKN